MDFETHRCLLDNQEDDRQDESGPCPSTNPLCSSTVTARLSHKADLGAHLLFPRVHEAPCLTASGVCLARLGPRTETPMVLSCFVLHVLTLDVSSSLKHAQVIVQAQPCAMHPLRPSASCSYVSLGLY